MAYLLFDSAMLLVMLVLLSFLFFLLMIYHCIFILLPWVVSGFPILSSVFLLSSSYPLFSLSLCPIFCLYFNCWYHCCCIFLLFIVFSPTCCYMYCILCNFCMLFVPYFFSFDCRQFFFSVFLSSLMLNSCHCISLLFFCHFLSFLEFPFLYSVHTVTTGHLIIFHSNWQCHPPSRRGTAHK